MAKQLHPRKVLIANRGEIASRVIRTCRDMEIQSVAVYSQADQGLPYVAMADEAYYLEGETSSQTYLNQDRLLEIAKQCGAEAIHPGYGFLAENSSFAKQCYRDGVLFVGPSADAIQSMGDKLMAREIAIKAGVPVVPGSPQIRNEKDIEQFASQHGYPLLIKASAGGGGHGMKMVENADQISSALRSAQSESAKAFGSDAVYVEKAIESPRHVEVQIFGFSDGGAVHLSTRDCSVQRRYQKIIEEAPAPFIKSTIADKMHQAATKLANSIDYRGAGTVEFLYDNADHFYFLEMNTRLQVEHPVTEAIFNLDLVEMQLRETFSAPQPIETIKLRQQQPIGHAIECRIYAEDPIRQFAPSPGHILELELPSGPGVRVDCGVSRNCQVSMLYDPMLAKIITHAENRSKAIQRMLRALHETSVVGIRTNVEFLKEVLGHQAFVKGDLNTHFIQQHQADLFATKQCAPPPKELLVASIFAGETIKHQVAPSRPLTAWQNQSEGNGL